jgi:heat-inducible transcriptional repressor
MRQLDAKTTEDRKRKVLHWVVHNYIKTSRPIASSIIADEAGLDLSSATIRNILKELEEEGCLSQPHTSSGRVPTDRGYRLYVDYLRDVQRLASDEKSRIEHEFRHRTEELDNLLAQTSRLLSHVSHKTGLVLSPRLEGQTLRRVELIALGGTQLLAVVVTETGQVRHWPLRMPSMPTAQRLRALNGFLNEHVCGRPVADLRAEISARIEQAGQEFRELHALADKVLAEIGGMMEPEGLYLDGTVSLMEGAEEFGGIDEIQALLRVMDERQALARLLEEEFRALEGPGQEPSRGLVRVRIGCENRLPELRNLSLVTTGYRMKDRVVGVLGILGPKRMEYSRMMSVVGYISQMVSRAIESWETGDAPGPAHPRRRGPEPRR